MFILYPQPNRQVAVVIPCGDINNAINDIPIGSEYKIVESLNIDDEYFEAYEFDLIEGAKINITKAKEIHYNKFRFSRSSLLEKLDISFMRAVETGDINLQKEIASQKQALRDVTSIDLPDTLEEIKEVWPEILKPRLL